jgi:hypothetical protein
MAPRGDEAGSTIGDSADAGMVARSFGASVRFGDSEERGACVRPAIAMEPDWGRRLLA